MRSRFLTALLGLLCISSAAQAYEEPVHRVVTVRAFERALVDWQPRLGFSLDTPAADAAQKWMSDGADDEDGGIRPLGHFFDPFHEARLTLREPFCLPAPLSTRADLWATEPMTINQYNVPRARQYYYTVLAGPNPGTRGVAQKELFLSLGHLVHLVQDMAQPEHTRNDVHLKLGSSFNSFLAGLVGEPIPSLYEAWTLKFIPGDNPVVSLDGYPNVKLADYVSYFHTLDGSGLADYANRNFVTQDTNYGDYGDIGVLPKCFVYSSPSQLAAQVRIEPEVAYALPHADGTCCYIRTVQDEGIYTWTTSAGEVDPFHSYHSSLDLETTKYDVNAKFYSLSDDSYKMRASMLMPRAVGYSAGFIEHFFRGKISAAWKRTGPGAVFSHELTLTNLSAERIGADAKVSAIYVADPAYFDRTNSDDTGTIFVKGELSHLAPGFNGLLPGQSTTFTVPSIFGLKDGDSLTKFERRVAIVGTLGTEQDAVIGLVQPPATGGMKIVLRYVTSSGNRAVFNLYDADGQLTVVFPNTNHNFIPNCKITVEPDGYVVEIDPPDTRPYQLYGFINGSLPCDEFGTATVEWYLEGTLVKTMNDQSISDCGFDYFGDSLP